MLSTTLLVLILTQSAVVRPADSSALLQRTVQVSGATAHLRFRAQDADSADQIAQALRRAIPAAERWGTFRVPVSITIHPTHRALEAATHQLGYAWLRAWARYASIDIQSPRTWSRMPTEHAMTQFLTHELTHCLAYQLSGSESDWATRQIPRWFLEGMASTTAGEEEVEVTSSSYDRAGGDPLRAPRALYRSQPDLVYATAHKAFEFLLHRFGADRVRRLMWMMADGDAFPDAFRRELGIPLEAFESDFERSAAISRVWVGPRRGVARPGVANEAG